MLVPADLIAAKLLVQMGELTPEQAQVQLRATAADPETEYDFVNRLAWELLIDPEQYEQIRYYVAKFEYIRQEAMFLWEIERRGLDKEEAYELLARIEQEAYCHRLADLLVDTGRLSADAVREVEQAALAQTRRNDEQVLAHYTATDFRDVSVPLIPGHQVTPDVFRLTILFRSDDTLALVRSKLESRGDGALASKDPLYAEALQGDPPERKASDWDERTSKMSRARLKVAPRETDTGSLEPLTSIGPYEVLERLGEGCFGAVYLGRKTGKEIVAIKLLSADEDDQERARFLREAQLLARFDHPHVIGLLDQGRTGDGRDYLALPAVAGQTLRELYLREGLRGGLPPERALRYAEQLLEGLQHVHERGVVHRDVKPENILIVFGADEVKLVDFGIARPIDSGAADIFQTQRGSISGSPAYLAPETIAGSPIDGRTDLYSLGVVLFEMLTGQRPLRADSPYGYLKEHMVAVPRTLARAQPAIPWPPRLEALLARLLAKTPEQRPASCQQVVDELRGGLRDEVLRAAHETAPAPPDGRVTSALNRYYHRPEDS